MNEKPNILYLSYDGMTDPLGQSQVIPYLERLSQEGYRFTLISFEKIIPYEKFSKKIVARLADSGIEWVPLTYTKEPPVFSTLWDLMRMKHTAYRLHKQKHFSLVHCRSYITAFVGMEMKRKLNVKFVFDMRGFYADERVEGGIWNLKNPLYKIIYRFFKKKEKEFFSEADYSICLTENGRKEIHTWKEVKNQPVRVEVIPCCADLKMFSRENVNQNQLKQLQKKLGIQEDDFVLSYLGSIGTWYMLDEMLDFFRILLSKKPKSKFLFITNEPVKNIIEPAELKALHEGRFIITPAPHNEVATYLALSDCSIFFIKPVYSKQASSPTKQGEIMGMGIPYICNTGVGDVDTIMQATQSGYLVNKFTDREYARVVDEMAARKPLYENIIKGAQQFYSLETGVKKYSQVYKKVLGSQQP
jgi:glycosyltransferase involved in cell wall biosynthesis